MTKVLIVNTPGLINRGGMGALMGALRCLRESLPEADVTMIYHYIKQTNALQEICQKYRVKLQKHPWFKEHDSKQSILLHSAIPALFYFPLCVFNRVLSKLGLPTKSVYDNSDIILDLNLVAINDYLNKFLPLWTLANIIPSLIAGKPVVVWSASIGVIKTRWIRFLVKIVLNRVDMIIAREDISVENLKTMGINNSRTYVTADHAFLLEAAPQERVSQILANEGIIKDKGFIVGFTSCQVIDRYAFMGITNRLEKRHKFVEVMARAIDYLVDKLNAQVVVISHCQIPTEDDRVMSREICELVKRKDKAKMLNGEYRADELKGIMGMCDLFIGCRFHSTVASTSMATPTIALTFVYKTRGVIGKIMGQEKYLIEVGKCEPEELFTELKAKIDDAWANRGAIRDELRKRSEAVNKLAFMNGSLVKDLIEKKLP
jgi:polysaccharide pyruvyl transferase WcaK-like protein